MFREFRPLHETIRAAVDVLHEADTVQLGGLPKAVQIEVVDVIVSDRMVVVHDSEGRTTGAMLYAKLRAQCLDQRCLAGTEIALEREHTTLRACVQQRCGHISGFFGSVELQHRWHRLSRCEVHDGHEHFFQGNAAVLERVAEKVGEVVVVVRVHEVEVALGENVRGAHIRLVVGFNQDQFLIRISNDQSPAVSFYSGQQVINQDSSRFAGTK